MTSNTFTDNPDQPGDGLDPDDLPVRPGSDKGSTLPHPEDALLAAFGRGEAVPGAPAQSPEQVLAALVRLVRLTAPAAEAPDARARADADADADADARHTSSRP